MMNLQFTCWSQRKKEGLYVVYTVTGCNRPNDSPLEKHRYKLLTCLCLFHCTLLQFTFQLSFPPSTNFYPGPFFFLSGTRTGKWSSKCFWLWSLPHVEIPPLSPRHIPLNNRGFFNGGWDLFWLERYTNVFGENNVCQKSRKKLKCSRKPATKSQNNGNISKSTGKNSPKNNRRNPPDFFVSTKKKKPVPKKNHTGNPCFTPEIQNGDRLHAPSW